MGRSFSLARVLTGNQHSDTFVIEANSGDDRITDFSNQDLILFAASSGVDDFGDLTLTAVGRDTLITWGTTDSLLVEGSCIGPQPHAYAGTQEDERFASLAFSRYAATRA